ncbi:MAG TPA: hypothetical protein VFJ57_10610 [Solirubrobacterales bacterium]|nr:hypothetical protein [Solirubrobacterales bacterium]
MSGVNPLGDGPTVVVAAVGAAEGARPAAAALACAGADAERAALLVDVGGRSPRPTLLTSATARALEERLTAHLPRARVAARGQTCHVAVAADGEGLAAATAAVTVARGSLAAVLLPPALLRSVLEEGQGPRPSAVLLRVDLSSDRPLLALLVRDLRARGLAVGVLKARLPWVAERRALFGTLPQSGGLPDRLVRQLCEPAFVTASDAGTDTGWEMGTDRGTAMDKETESVRAEAGVEAAS